MTSVYISGIDYLTSWIAVAFKVDSAQECSNSSGFVPRLDRWLASELIKGLKGVPELQVKVQGYIEGCARQSVAPHGRAVIQMISRHFGLDRVRGSLITSQSVFLVELNGYSVRFARFLIHLHEHSHPAFAGICMESLPFPEPTSAFRVFPLTSSLHSGEPTAAATEGVAGEAFAGTAGVFALGFPPFFGLRRDCSMDRAFTSSRSSAKNSCNFPQRLSNSRMTEFSGDRLIS